MGYFGGVYKIQTTEDIELIKSTVLEQIGNFKKYLLLATSPDSTARLNGLLIGGGFEQLKSFPRSYQEGEMTLWGILLDGRKALAAKLKL